MTDEPQTESRGAGGRDDSDIDALVEEYERENRGRGYHER